MVAILRKENVVSDECDLPDEPEDLRQRDAFKKAGVGDRTLEDIDKGIHYEERPTPATTTTSITTMTRRGGGREGGNAKVNVALLAPL